MGSYASREVKHTTGQGNVEADGSRGVYLFPAHTYHVEWPCDFPLARCFGFETLKRQEKLPVTCVLVGTSAPTAEQCTYCSQQPLTRTGIHQHDYCITSSYDSFRTIIDAEWPSIIWLRLRRTFSGTMTRYKERFPFTQI